MPYKDEEQQRKAQNASYDRHRAEVLARTATRRRNNQRWLDEYKKSIACACGESHPACIEFHHTDPLAKDMSIGDAAWNWGLKRLQKEITKCVPVCSNCHKKIHWEWTQNPPHQSPNRCKRMTNEQRAQHSTIMKEYYASRRGVI